VTEKKSIAYLNQYFLEHPSLLPALMDIDPRLPALIYRRNEFEKGNASAWYTRIGKNTMFCNNTGQFDFSKPILDFSKPFSESFEQVSDQRCVDLRKSHWHKPWVVMWSGGIDSTTVMTSILRNLPSSDFKNIQVWCNSASVFENPRFFMDHIRPNFKVISHRSYNDMCNDEDVFVIAGESGYVLGIEKYKWHADRSGHNDQGQDRLWTDRDHLVSYCDSTGWPATPGIDFANWLYNVMEENIRSTGLPILTVREWWWWFVFNHNWTGNIMQHVYQYCGRESHGRFLENFIPWVHSDLYQQWAIHNLNDIVRMKNKSIAKQYIHSVSGDQCFLDFKMKVVSNRRDTRQMYFDIKMQDRPRMLKNPAQKDDRIICILNNRDCLYVDQDVDLISDLLPAHINLDSLRYLD
jgi:hypothetical protein